MTIDYNLTMQIQNTLSPEYGGTAPLTTSKTAVSTDTSDISNGSVNIGNRSTKSPSSKDPISARSAIHTPAGGGASSTGSKDNSAVSMLKELIESLQAQLAQAEQQMARASRKSSQAADGASNDAMAGAAAAVNQISAAIQMATAELVQLMLASGQTTGLVDAQA